MGMRKDGEAVYIIGASRSGKTQYAMIKICKELNKKYKRLLIWDFNGQWYGLFKRLGVPCDSVSGKAQLAARLRGDKKAGIVCYTPSPFSQSIREQFDFFCGAGFIWVKESPACLVVEEISSVVDAGAAKGNWQIVQTQMQKYGGSIYAIIQRGQEGDKTTMTQATEVTVFRSAAKDMPYLMDSLDIQKECMPNDDLQFCLIDKRGKKSLGVIEFNPNEPEGADNPAKHNLKIKAL